MNNDDILTALTALQIPQTHVTVGWSNLVASHKDLRSLLVNRRLPDTGWSDVQIQHVLYMLSTLDTNNKTTTATGNSTDSSSRWCGVGEREGRVYSPLVAQRHYGLSHGMGRSGDITEPQPKAVGSSVLVQLTTILALDAIRRGSGLKAAAHGILLPLCTGMSMSVVLSSLRAQASSVERNVVLWSRIDQKTCFKAIASAGLQCVVVPTVLQGDEVVTDLKAMQAALETYQDQVLAVITTTSCFAPRVRDRVDQVAKLCKGQGVFHVINNAYGLQCAVTSKLINRAAVVGRVDAVVCSTDKNFLVPVGEYCCILLRSLSCNTWTIIFSNRCTPGVASDGAGGAIVMSPHKSIIENVGKVYAGRASSSPIVDLFITLLSMGLQGYQKILADRLQALQTFPTCLAEVAEKHGERLLQCPANTISFGITLDGLVTTPRKDNETDEDYGKRVSREISSFGAMLFSRCVSGTRVVPRFVTKNMGGQVFCGYGSSIDEYPHAYMTAACAIGVSPAELDEFFVRLDKTLRGFKKKQAKR